MNLRRQAPPNLFHEVFAIQSDGQFRMYLAMMPVCMAEWEQHTFFKEERRLATFQVSSRTAGPSSFGARISAV